MESAARAAGLGTIYVWNPHGGAIRKFVSYCGSPNVAAGATETAPVTIESGVERAGDCGSMALTTEEHAVEARYVEVAPHLGTVWVATGGTWKLDHDGVRLKSQRGLRVSLARQAIPNYHPGSPTAVDYLTDRNLRGWVQDYVSEHGLDGATSALRAAFDYLSAHLDATFSFTQGIQITFEVTFFDGSSVILQQSLNQLAEFKPGSARDDSGQTLPEGNSAENAGRWSYDATSQAHARRQFLELMGRYNVTVTTLDPRGSRIHCTWDGRTLHCTVRS